MHSIQQNAMPSKPFPEQSEQSLQNDEAEEYAILTSHPELERNAKTRINELAAYERLHQVGDDWLWRPYPEEAYEKQSHEWYMRESKEMPPVVVNHSHQRYSAEMTMSQEVAAPHGTDESSEDDSGADCDEFVDGMDDHGGRSAWLGTSRFLPYETVSITMYFPSDDENDVPSSTADESHALEATSVVASTSTSTEGAEAGSSSRRPCLNQSRGCTNFAADQSNWRSIHGKERCSRCGQYWRRKGRQKEWDDTVHRGGAH